MFLIPSMNSSEICVHAFFLLSFFFFSPHCAFSIFPWLDPEKTSLDFLLLSSVLSFYCLLVLSFLFFVSFSSWAYFDHFLLDWCLQPVSVIAAEATVVMRSSYKDMYFVPVHTVQTGAQLKRTLISYTRFYSKMLTANLRYAKF